MEEDDDDKDKNTANKLTSEFGAHESETTSSKYLKKDQESRVSRSPRISPRGRLIPVLSRSPDASPVSSPSPTPSPPENPQPIKKSRKSTSEEEPHDSKNPFFTSANAVLLRPKTQGNTALSIVNSLPLS